MHVCMVTPHVPPYQSANAILPQIIAAKLKEDGHKVSFIVPDKALTTATEESEYLLSSCNVTRSEGLSRKLKLDLIKIASSVYFKSRKVLESVDVVHLHSNGLLHQIITIASERMRIPHLITHYGTEIWHYKKKRIPLFDPFLYINKSATSVVYYSRKLAEYSFELGIQPDNPVTIYPPASDDFKQLSQAERIKLRKELNIKAQNVLVNVKRLHPLGGHEFLLKAMPNVIRQNPDTHLYICGDGKLRADLENLSKKLKIDSNVTFLGMVDNTEVWKYYAAADFYVLTSVLEALPTVAVEALASGTPVIITDTPGGKELAELFKEDLHLVKMRNVEQISDTITEQITRKKRTSAETEEIINKYFRTESMYKDYLREYEKALTS